MVLVDDPAAPGSLLLHRLVEYNERGQMITKGDANVVRDSTPVPVENLRGVARLRVPLVGQPVLWVQDGRYVPVVALAVLLTAVILWRPATEPAEQPARATGRA